MGQNAPDNSRASEPTRAASEPGTAPTIPAMEVTRPSAGGDVLTGQVWGDFLVGPLLGRGGMGAVYRGRQRSLDRDVAIKVLPPHLSDNEGFRSRFQLEAKAVASLDSPHIIKVYGAGETDGHHYFAMEYVEGQDLSQTLRRLGKPTRQQALEWVLQAARGLQAAGELGIVHRDIKPANMMLTRKGVVKLMDFGLVRSTKEAHGLTMTGTVMGTVSYFSPEQGRGERCDSRTDLYALGVVFYEFLTGRLPFTGEDPTSIIYQHIHVAPVLPREVDPSIPEDYQSVVMKCLQKRAEDRYQEAAELVADLERLARGDKPAISADEAARLRMGTTLFVPGGRGAAKRRLAPMIIAATAVSVAAATAIWLSRGASAPEPGITPPPLPVTAHGNPGTATPATVVPVPAVQPPMIAPPPAIPPIPAQATSPLVAKVQELLKASRFAEARALVGQERATKPDDQSLAGLSRAIDATEGSALLVQARADSASGDFPSAKSALDGARTLLGSSSEVAALAKELDQRQARLAAQLDAARTQAAAGKGDEAQASLAQAGKEFPEAPAVAAAATAVKAELERQAAARAARDAAVARGRAALAEADLDGADAAFAEALKTDPADRGATEGGTAVAAKRAELATFGKRIAEAVAAKDLPAAQRCLELLTAAAPRAPVTAAARSSVDDLRAKLDEERRQAEELEAHRSGMAKAILAATADLAVPVPDLEEDLRAFLREAGLDRPEKAAIEARIDDRRQRDAVAAGLAELDKAVLSGDRAAIARLVTDEAHAAALGGLIGQDGLVFASAIDTFARDGASAAATVRIRHALASYPETVLVYRYDLRRTPTGWTIAAATRNE